ncbi:dTDP-4-dehydrorhamnose reductase [Aneurinibacillus tyrosinisolvens]|uniref:dTDP-4-dehydrorhamnose reductase n=1 Tax=Aneurinibacillus tyrosinisolvens TaxID=1443435 RepID=UPI00063FCF05|nr:dTDP-4-dehydrorhamnose reductase [Aneurinibacillus tyrosinisolvens]
MKILLIGGYGLLGDDIYKVFSYNQQEIIRIKREHLDILDTNNLEETISLIRPELVINASGYTNVAMAEREFEKAFQVNCLGIYNLVNTLKKYDIPLIHFSTDYVFEGGGSTPYKEDDPAIPLNKYGLTKKISEDIIVANYDKYYIIRTSWLFGSNGKCFPRTILQKLSLNEKIYVVNDQFGTPTYTRDLAEGLLNILRFPFGLYHVTNDGYTTWFDYALLVASYMKLNEKNIFPVTSDEQYAGVNRPKFSVLSNEKWSDFAPQLRPYNKAVECFLQVLQ